MSVSRTEWSDRMVPGRRSVWTARCLRGLLSVAMAICARPTGSVEAQSIGGRWSRPEDVTRGIDVESAMYGQLICDQDQGLHLLWAGVSGEGTLLYYQRRVDRTWEQANDVLFLEHSTIVRLSAGLSVPDQTIHTVWESGYLKGDLAYSRAALPAGGRPTAWLPPQVLAEGIDRANLKVDSEGTVHVVFGSATDNDYQGEVFYMRSDDNGETWSRPSVVFSSRYDLPVYAHPEITVDLSHRIWVGVNVRSQDYGVYSEVGYVRSDDEGYSWSRYQFVDDLGATFQGVAIIAPFSFGGNEIHLTWHDPRRLHQWSSDGGQSWSSPVEIMSLGAAFGGPNQLVRDSAGDLYALVATGSGVFSARWDGREWGECQQVDDRSFDPHGQEIVACEGNELHVVYYDRTGTNRLWYSTFHTNGPHIGPSQPPWTPAAPLARTIVPTRVATALVTLADSSLPPTPASYGPETRSQPSVFASVRPLALPAILVLTLLSIVLVCGKAKRVR